jgi:serine/threonine protein kinase
MEINEVWSEWKAEKLIGEGSFGKVYKCSKTIDGETEYCAVKVISVPKSDLEADTLRLDGMTASETKEYYREIVNEFVNEIKLLQKLKKCSNIVHMYDYKVIERTESVGWDIFIRMELLTTFTEYVSDKEISREDVLNFGLDICNALVECEKYNIIHRDIKPENIFVYNDGIYKLGDFGTAKEFEQTLASYSMKGTYNYMSPEVFNGKKYNARADIYSLGLVMYRMMNNNRVPFIDPDKQMVKHQDRVDALSKRLKGDPMPKPKNADENLSAIILKACAFNPDDRYINARELRAALETELDNTKKRNKFQIVCSNVGYTVKRHKIISSIIAAVLIIAIIGGTAFAHRNTVATWMGIEPSSTTGDTNDTSIAGNQDTTQNIDSTANENQSTSKSGSKTGTQSNDSTTNGFAVGQCVATVGNTSAVTDYKGVRIVNELTGTEESIYSGACGSVAFDGKRICFAHTIGYVTDGNNSENNNKHDEIIMYNVSSKKSEIMLQVDDSYITIIYFNSSYIFYHCTNGLYKYDINTKKSKIVIDNANIEYETYYNESIYYGITLENDNFYSCDLYVYDIKSSSSTKIDTNVNGDSISFHESDVYYLQYNYSSAFNNSSRLVMYSNSKKLDALSPYYINIIDYTSDNIITDDQVNTSESWYYVFSMIDINTKAVTKIDTPTDVKTNDLDKFNNRLFIISGSIYALSYSANEIAHLYKVFADGTLEKYKYVQISGGLPRHYTITDNMIYTWNALGITTETVCYKLSPEK